MKIPPVGAELFLADGHRQTYMTKLTDIFRNCAKAPKNENKLTLYTILTYIHTACLTIRSTEMYEGWNFNSGYYLFTTDTK